MLAVRPIMEGLRQEERENNIRSTHISPGTVDTELHLTIHDPKRGEWTENLQRAIGLQASNVADAEASFTSTAETVIASFFQHLLRWTVGTKQLVTKLQS